MLAFLSMHCGVSHRKFHKPRWASTLNQKHLFVITSLSTTQFEYGVKFLMETKIFHKIMEFMLTLGVISPSFMLGDERRSSMGEESSHHLWQMLCKCYVAKVLRSKKKWKWKMKKIWWEEKKSKERRKKENKEKKWEGNKMKCTKNKDAPRFFLLHKFLSALKTNLYSIFQPCAIR
jgi:hypothetical protein